MNDEINATEITTEASDASAEIEPAKGRKRRGRKLHTLAHARAAVGACVRRLEAITEAELVRVADKVARERATIYGLSVLSEITKQSAIEDRLTALEDLLRAGRVQ